MKEHIETTPVPSKEDEAPVENIGSPPVLPEKDEDAVPPLPDKDDSTPKDDLDGKA
jgi:hypothetical protein